MARPPDLRKYAGYTAVDVRLEECRLRGHWVMLEEELETPGLPEGLIVVARKNTTIGNVLLVGDKVGEDIRPGDRVLFAEWQGGRWSFLRKDGSKVNCLLMDESHVQARLGRARRKGSRCAG